MYYSHDLILYLYLINPSISWKTIIVINLIIVNINAALKYFGKKMCFFENSVKFHSFFFNIFKSVLKLTKIYKIIFI